MSCPQVGHSVFSVKNLCSLVIFETLLEILPFKLFSLTNFSLAPVTLSCSLIYLCISSSTLALSSYKHQLLSKVFQSFFICIDIFISTVLKFFMKFSLHLHLILEYFSLLRSRDFTCSFINSHLISLIILFIAEKIRISSRSSITSRRLEVVNCIKGTKVLLPRITI